MTITIQQITESSNVFKVAHDDTNLYADMKGGSYVYKNVPREHYEGIIAAESAGSYLNGHIKPNYQYEKMECDIETFFATATAPAGATPVHEAIKDINSAIADQQVKRLVQPHFNNWGLTPVKLQVLDPNVSVQYAKPGDAAFDLQACIAEPKIVYPGERVLFKAGFAVSLPQGLCGLVIPRSGSALKQGVAVVNSPGLIDSGYRGEIGVIYENRGQDPVTVKPYDRIAQFLITPAITPIFEIVDTLDETERGAAGFGSSGVEASPLQPRTKSA